MIKWFFNSNFVGMDAERLFGTLHATFSVAGERVSAAPLSSVDRVAADGTRYYVKRYVGNGKSAWHRWFGLRGFLAPQRVVQEWENLIRFQQWGIPTATLVSWGIERRFGYFIRGALVTKEIPSTLDMGEMDNNNDSRLSDRYWVAQVVSQVARYVRRLHAEKFAHNDLHWRNLLVDTGSPPTVYLIDCPRGRFWFGPMLQYRIVKDLACLDKVGRLRLSRTQRLRFYLDYCGRHRLSVADKRRIRKILACFTGNE